MQLIRYLLPIIALLVFASRVHAEIEEQQATYVFQMFTDSDDVHVMANSGVYGAGLTPNTGLDVHWKHEVVVVPGIDAVPGTDEAVDAITAASRPISGASSGFEEYSKARDEVEGSLRYKNFTGGYYVSSEEDYFAQQISANATHTFFKDVGFSAGASYGWDNIQPLEDDDGNTGDSKKTTMHMNVIATRAFTPTTEVQGGLELTEVEGLQHNPYRNVYVDGSRVPERHPEDRLRRDAFFKVSQYLMNRSSARLTYKFYNDDWGVTSHMMIAQLNQYVSDPISVRYRYRYYTQDAADFYRDEYTEPNGVGGYQTGDYRLSSFSAHLLGARLAWGLGRPFGWQALQGLQFTLEYERYFNTHNFSANMIESGLSFTF
ncbi:MAG TPA: DUF3570 domain-containing protein [bacterium]|nr:DUF3570 domain-containing protein [bacterium]